MLVCARFEDGSRMGDEELRGQLLTLLLAGHETTATALAWTFDLLVHDRPALERLTAELAGGGHEYLDAVINESLRVRPVVPFTGRKLRADAELGGFGLPAGTVVMAGIYLVHTRPDVYADPRAFRPERFLADDPPDSFAWIPFGGGTRRCIGAAFAQFEMRIAIETIVRAVELRAVSPRLERPIRRNVTLSPARGTRVIATPRS
jgi:cytochrome P450